MSLQPPLKSKINSIIALRSKRQTDESRVDAQILYPNKYAIKYQSLKKSNQAQISAEQNGQTKTLIETAQITPTDHKRHCRTSNSLEYSQAIRLEP